jgi:hypothetical protein
MRSAAAGIAASMTAVDIFRACAEARAILYCACELELHEAVDVLQAAAERNSLVDELGEDRVQQIIAAAFHKECR